MSKCIICGQRYRTNRTGNNICPRCDKKFDAEQTPHSVDALATGQQADSNKATPRRTGFKIAVLIPLFVAAVLIIMTLSGTLIPSISGIRFFVINLSGEEALVSALKNPDENWDIRIRAAKALGEIGDERAKQVLTEAVADEVYDVQEGAAKALGIIGGDYVINSMFAILQDKDENEWTRQGAAMALGYIGGESVTEALITILLDQSTDSTILPSASFALGRIGDKRVAEKLIAALRTLKKQDPAYSLICSTLAQCTDEGAVEVLTNALRDEQRDIRVAVMEALITSKGESIAQTLLDMLADTDLSMIAEKYTYFIKAGVSGSETELISALNEYGDKIMAEAYLNCGNPDLETAAKDWAVAHDYMITSSPNGLNSLSWGSE